MNVNAVLDLLVPIAKKSMRALQVHVQIMVFVLTYHKDMKAIPTNVYVHGVSIIFAIYLHTHTELRFGIIIIIKHVLISAYLLLKFKCLHQ